MSGMNGSAGQSSEFDREDCDSITKRSLIDLLERQEFCCALTGRILTPETASADHIVPLSRGGKHVIGNVQIIHNDVNRAKGTMTLDEFALMCREVVEHAVQMGN